MKKILLFSALLGTYQTSRAFRMEWGQTVIISKPLYEDLYIAGGDVTINAPVYGDVIVAGGTLNLNDTITNDLLLAGGTVNINGYVGDDIRCAGGRLHVLKNIGGDLVIAGGRIEVAKNAVIYGGLMSSGGELVIDGTIGNTVKINAGKLTFNGKALKDFESHSDKLLMNGTVSGPTVLAARSMTIGPSAEFGDNVRYWSRKSTVDFKQSIKNGKATYDSSLRIKGKDWYYLGRTTALGLIWYLGTAFLFLMIIQYLFSSTLRKAGDTVARSMSKSLLWGFLFVIGMPLAILLLLVTVIGIPVGLILIFTYVGILILATVTAALVMANWYNLKFETNWNFWQIVGSAFVFFILFKLISFTPFLGWLIMMGIAFIAFGSILRNIDWTRRQRLAM